MRANLTGQSGLEEDLSERGSGSVERWFWVGGKGCWTFGGRWLPCEGRDVDMTTKLARAATQRKYRVRAATKSIRADFGFTTVLRSQILEKERPLAAASGQCRSRLHPAIDSSDVENRLSMQGPWVSTQRGCGGS